MKMRTSRVLERLRAGGVATCSKLNLGDPRVAEIAAMSGLDCIWIDLEHVPNCIKDIENQIRAIKLHHADTLVRVAKGSYSDLIYPLEMDASGIMVPHVMSAAEARQIVRQTRFHPIGRRPLDGGNADGAYCEVAIDDYLVHANAQKLLVVQIEDPEAMDELDEIAQIDGIDMLFFGPADFSQGLGVPGALDDPRIIDARCRIAQAANANGKFAGTVGSLGNLPELIDLGYRFISIGADVVALGSYFKNIAQSMGKIINSQANELPIGR